MFKVLLFTLALIFSINISADNLEKNIDKTVQDLSTESKKLEDSAFTNIISEKMKKIVADYIKDNPFSNMKRSDISNILESRTEGTPVGNYLKSSPRLKNTLVDLLKDKEAMPRFFGIINKPDVMKKYSYCVITIMILSFLYTTFRVKGSFIKRFFRKLLVSIFVLCFNLGLFYYFFSAEIRPGLNVIFKHFHL